MKRLLPWILNVLLLAAIVFLIFVLDDDGTDDAEASPRSTTTTTTTRPDRTAAAFISDGPVKESLLMRLGRSRDLDLSQWDPDDWRLAQVREIKGESMSVRDGSGVILLYPADSCSDENDELSPNYFGALFNPGDWALWEDVGNDTRICDGEIALVKEG